MTTAATAQAEAATNPLFGNRPLKLGTFSTNLRGGGTISKMAGLLKADWPATLELARLADAMDFEAIVPVGRWKGFGGETNFNGEGFEVFVWAAGLSAATQYSSVFATSHIPTVHPLFAAKQAAAIDHIGRGRFALNLVTGWYTPEMDMFGITLLDHDSRYEMAEEWVRIVTRLWTDPEPFDFDGRFYRMKRAELAPKPLQQPRPPLMSAAGSDRGRRFAAQYCDVCFIAPESHDPLELKAKVDKYRDYARDEFKRDIQVWSNAYVFHGDSEADGKALWNHCVHEQGDWAGVQNMLDVMGVTSQLVPPHVLGFLKQHFIAGWGGYPLVGGKEQVVEGLGVLKQAGFDGILLTWPRWREGLTRFRDEVMPLLRQTGLR
jgi:alkanesulfonate monooxygenase SsuD/methylene tetrahydromethanopterin reductase-like flavin-dependent oxidoreductase (luciferase family)